MNLPPLPEPTLVEIDLQIYTSVQMRKYGELCRQQALEEAARICDTTPPEPFRPSIEAAHAIRSLIK